MKDEVVIVGDGHGGILGYLICYGAGENRGVVEAFSPSGDVVGAYSSKRQAAVAIATRGGIWSRHDH